MEKPTLEQVKAHFEKAKEIRCMKLDAVINVAHVKDFTWNEEEQSWNGPASIVTFWKDGKFAEITRKKCNPEDCAGCKPCAEKRKNK